ncbi:MAG TPA: type IVB secretion system protein IcmH/DotU [Burkholderiaceae bacterium]|nr:type IVB secretion system protein IcmH/DotU [Burkholderiaceae bacterium]
MNTMIDRRTASDLSGNQRRDDRVRDGHAHSLVDLLQEGLLLLFILQSGAKPPNQSAFEQREHANGSRAEGSQSSPDGQDAGASKPSLPTQAPPRTWKEVGTMDETLIREKIMDFLAEFDREARKMRSNAEDIEAAKYAFCALLDEVIHGAGLAMSVGWKEFPLQITVCGDHTAGYHFFDRLEALRSKGGTRLQALQAFHLMLLLGFRGKYAHEADDKLTYLTARLGEEIAHIKGKSKGFAPQAERPDQVINKLRSELSLWALTAVFAAVALGTYLGMKSSLDHRTQSSMAAYADLIKLAPQPAHVTITLP